MLRSTVPFWSAIHPLLPQLLVTIIQRFDHLVVSPMLGKFQVAFDQGSDFWLGITQNGLPPMVIPAMRLGRLHRVDTGWQRDNRIGHRREVSRGVWLNNRRLCERWIPNRTSLDTVWLRIGTTKSMPHCCHTSRSGAPQIATPPGVVLPGWGESWGLGPWFFGAASWAC